MLRPGEPGTPSDRPRPGGWTVKLYYVPRTRASRPRWLLEELGVPYELFRLDTSKKETRAPEHLARHPLGHVPVLEADGIRIFESMAICLWLAERYADKGLLAPAGTPARAETYQWLFFAATELEPPLQAISTQGRKPEAERDAARVDEARRQFLAAAAVIEARLAGRTWLVGDAFSVADVVVGSVLLWGKSSVGVEGLSQMTAYLARLKDRPAWRRAVKD
jgi:glutathione S-transferase